MRIVRRVLRATTSHSLFEMAIMAVIIANTIVLCVEHFDQSHYENTLW
jgi:hypothetical protein